MKKTLVFVEILLVSLISSSALAMQFNFPTEKSSNSIINISDEIKDNLFSAGYQVNNEASVIGDAFLFGMDVSQNGNISNNLFVGSQIADIKGKIDHDLFVGATTVNLNKDTVIANNAYIGSSTANLAGIIKGNLYVATNTLTISGTVEGNIQAEVTNLTLEKTAIVKGTINYTSQNDLKIEDGAVYSGIEKKDQTVEKNNFIDITFWTNKLFSLLSLLLVGVILLTLIPKKSEEITNTIKNRFWSSFGWGLIVLIILPIIMLFSMIIIIGFPLAMILFSIYLTIIYLSKIFVGIVIGSLILRGKWLAIWYMTLGLILIILITMLPWIGNLVNFVIPLLGLGAVYLVIKGTIKNK